MLLYTDINFYICGISKFYVQTEVTSAIKYWLQSSNVSMKNWADQKKELKKTMEQLQWLRCFNKISAYFHQDCVKKIDVLPGKKQAAETLTPKFSKSKKQTKIQN